MTSFPKTLNENPLEKQDRSNIAVSCHKITKEFGSGDTKVQVLRGVNAEISFGEMSLLVGPSGCGKTTLISIICGLLDPTEGDLFVLNENVGKMSGRKKTAFRSQNVGFVFQQYNLLPALTAEENAAIPLVISGMKKRQAVARAAEVLNQVGLGNKLKSLPSQLSGGQQQRVAIARALVHNPRLLVCDEPTAALDAKSGQTVMELLTQVGRQKDRAVIVVTHDSRVYKFGDRIIEMNDGLIERVVFPKIDGSPYHAEG
ncbi:MAG: ABC transporter ATP-binding protein [Gemmataceae bacterium]|jgi:putative ABC transport system ATP-binding protein|nr:ABC transporter ATP-binding protein [Gemmataceae bacterium]